MDIDHIANLVSTASWFSNLGCAQERPGLIAVREEQWRAALSQSVSAEFGLPHDRSALVASPLSQVEWLPCSIHEDDPVHGAALAQSADRLGLTAEFKAARMGMFKRAQVSLRSMPKLPMLHVGPVDMSGPARGAALFAFRSAAGEVVVGEPGVWCGLLSIYHSGNWPLGHMPGGEVLVL